MAVLEDRYEALSERFVEFMSRTDARLDQLIEQSNEWAGVRKTLAVLAGLVTMIGGFVGYMVHYFWPPPQGH